jgi:glycosyltransferase involved in cell wall biosynthesis
MSRRRVLFLSPRFPFPPDRGDRLHAYHVLRALSRRYEVTVAGFGEFAESTREGKRVLEDWGVHVRAAPLPLAGRLVRLGSSLLSSRPLQVSYYAEPAMHRLLREVSSSEPPFDALVCHLIRMAPFARSVPARVKIIDLADSVALGLARRLAHAPLLERPSIWLEARRVHRFEEKIVSSFDEGWVVSEIDQARFPGSPPGLVVIPPGIDESLFEGDVQTETPPTVGFLGHLSVPHNVDAVTVLVREILPLLLRRGLDAHVLLIGAAPSSRVKRLTQNPRVQLAGFVPRLAGALQGLRVLCAPIRFSAGVQSKLIDALAAGAPVLTSPEAAEALGEEVKQWIHVARSPEEYADAIARLWNRTPVDVERLKQAREWARGHFRWESYADRLDQILDRKS